MPRWRAGSWNGTGCPPASCRPGGDRDHPPHAAGRDAGGRRGVRAARPGDVARCPRGRLGPRRSRPRYGCAQVPARRVRSALPPRHRSARSTFARPARARDCCGTADLAGWMARSPWANDEPEAADHKASTGCPGCARPSASTRVPLDHARTRRADDHGLHPRGRRAGRRRSPVPRVPPGRAGVRGDAPDEPADRLAEARAPGLPGAAARPARDGAVDAGRCARSRATRPMRRPTT